MASVAEWDHEAEQLAIVVEKSSMINLDELNLAELTDEQLAALEIILFAMNEAYSLNIEQAVTTVNDLLERKHYETRVIGVADYNGNGSNQEEWDEEIARLIQIISAFRHIESLNVELINNNAQELGAVLDLMKVSYLFGNDTMNNGDTDRSDDVFNSLMCEILEECHMIESPINANGFISQAEAQETDWTVYNYETELVIITQYDTSKPVEEQDDDVIKELSHSQIILDFFDIASIINDKVEGRTTTIYGQTLILSDYVNGGQPLTNDDLQGAEWSQEIDDINAINAAFDEADTDSTAFKADIDALAEFKSIH